MDARSSALRRRLFGRPDRQLAKGGGELVGVEPRASGCPVPGSELEVAVAGPVGEHAEQVAQVCLGVEPVQLAGGDEREQVGGGLGVIVAGNEQPGFSADGDATELAL